MSEATQDPTPISVPDVLDAAEVDRILADMQGFGITDSEQLITMTVKNRTVNLRLANLSTDDEIHALIANLEIKGHVWVHQMRCDLLSRAVTWINGVTITKDLYATDPLSGETRPIRPILREMFLRWGGQPVLVLWKIYMVHCQRVEDNLTEQLPDSQIMTTVEARFLNQVAEELKAVGVAALTESVEEPESDEPTPD